MDGVGGPPRAGTRILLDLGYGSGNDDLDASLLHSGSILTDDKGTSLLHGGVVEMAQSVEEPSHFDFILPALHVNTTHVGLSLIQVCPPKA